MTITQLPSMIRVDGTNRMDFVYDEISEALGEEEGYFDNAEFEENMSTHYGRMIHEDDRTIMFANPEDAAEYSASTSRPPRSDPARLIHGDPLRRARVRERRREVLRRRQSHALLGRESGRTG